MIKANWSISDHCFKLAWSSQSTLKEISPEHSLEGLMLKLKLQYFGHLIWRTDSYEKTLMLGKIEGGRRRGWQRMRRLMASPTQWTRVWVNSGSWWWTGRPGVLQSMGSQRVGHVWATELNWFHVPSLPPCYQSLQTDRSQFTVHISKWKKRRICKNHEPFKETLFKTPKYLWNTDLFLQFQCAK